MDCKGFAGVYSLIEKGQSIYPVGCLSRRSAGFFVGVSTRLVDPTVTLALSNGERLN